MLLELYYSLTIRARIALLCACYSGCLLMTAVAGQLFGQTYTWLAAGAFTLAGAFFGWLNIVGIRWSITNVISRLETMASGDLSVEIKARRNNEFSQILRGLGKVQASLRMMVQRIQATSDELAGASDSLAAAAHTISSGTADAAEQSRDVAMAVDDVVGSSAEISSNCDRMTIQAHGTKGAAVAGSRKIDDMSDTMTRISSVMAETSGAVKSLGDSSDHIGQIIQSIEEIAEQTNLLALNAAIEAARAGEQGRGFAVVADEVRALSERTTGATREIKGIITSLQKDVAQVVRSTDSSLTTVAAGIATAGESRGAMGDIARDIETLAHEVDEVAGATKLQSASTARIRESIQVIAAAIGAAADSARATDASAEALQKSARELADLARSFKL